MPSHVITLNPPKEDSVYYILPQAEVCEKIEKYGVDFEIRLPEEKNPASSPLIAVILGLDNGDYAMDKNMVRALETAGARLTFIHYEMVDDQLENIHPDGFLLPGGNFDSPADFYLHPEFLSSDHQVSPRSLAYVYAIDYANENLVPMLGICAGFQMIAGMSGAKMYVNLQKELDCSLPHKEDKNKIAHSVNVEPGSCLSRISGNSAKLDVNSIHGEGVVNTNEGLDNLHISAWSSDNVAEAIEKSGAHFVMGVQWHPEYLFERDKNALAVFEALIKAAEAYKEKKDEN